MKPKRKVKKVKKVERPAPIQVRLPFDLLAALDKKAEETGLTRHALIVGAVDKTYLHVSKPAAPDGLVYGWADPEGAKALGDAIGRLAALVADNGSVPGDPELDHPERLAMLKVAIVKVLDHLGASANLSSEQVTLAELAARQCVNEFERVGYDRSVYGQRPDLAVMAELKRCIWLDRRALNKPKE